ncbi:hypothetical protein MJD09_25405 [bacterium]|nr:hypothetical protein [bacterium]
MSKPEDYDNSSFKKFVELGEYEPGWGHDEPENLLEMDQRIEPSLVTRNGP